MSKTIRRKRTIAIVMVLCVAFSFMPLMSQARANGSAEDISSPRVSDGVTTWDCVYFGSYPQTEIVSEPSQCGTYHMLWGKDDDYQVDSKLYGKLENAEYDSDGDTVIDGKKYHRMTVESASNQVLDYSLPGGYWTLKEYDSMEKTKKEDLDMSIKSYVDYVKEETDTESVWYNWCKVPVRNTWTAYHYFRYDPIKWRVLNKENNQAMLLSDLALDCPVLYDIYDETIDSDYHNWEKSMTRSWLNGYSASTNSAKQDYSSNNFINRAFSSEEQNAIKDTDLQNDDKGENTVDRVFLLSGSDLYGTSKAMSYGFNKSASVKDAARTSKSSTYAKAMGTYIENDDQAYLGNAKWSLRSNLLSNYVSYEGVVTYDSDDRSLGYRFGIRPAIYLDLSSAKWTDAGTVSGEPNKSENNQNKNVSHLKIRGLKNKTYTGRSIQQKIVVIDDSKTLREGTDYTVAYMNNKNVGNATVTVTGVGNYTGSVNVKFYIIPAGTDIKKLSKGKKCFIVKWKKQSAKMSKSRISGYKIRYSRKSSMKGAKTKTVKGYKKTSRKITGLSKKKKYYVQVRTYKKIGSYVYYSNWSKAKTVKTS